MQETILVVDDEDAIVEFIEINLERAGYAVLTAHSGSEALDTLRHASPTLVVLDIMMPDMDGFAVCRELRTFSNVPVIMLTARSEDRDKISGLETGADAYLVKPFNPDELVAWIQAILRRNRSKPNSTLKPLQFGDLVIDPNARRVTRCGKPIELSPRETDLLLFFATNPGRIFSRAEVRKGVWGDEFLEERTVDVHVRRLRDKLADEALEPRYIATVWGQGYKSIAPCGEVIETAG
jgi:DNA-binding response OmpR family regulator